MSGSAGSSWTYVGSRRPDIPSGLVSANSPTYPWLWAPRSGDSETPDDLADSLDWADDEYDFELADLELLWEEYGMIWGFRSSTETFEEQTRRKAREEEIRRMIEEAELRAQTKPNQRAKKEAMRKAKEEEMARRMAGAQTGTDCYASSASSQFRRSVPDPDGLHVLRGPNTRTSDLSRLSNTFKHGGREFSPSIAFGETSLKRGVGGSRPNEANRVASLSVGGHRHQNKKWALAPAPTSLLEISAWYKVEGDVKEYLSVKNVDKAIVALQALPAEHRHILVGRLVNDALDSGDHVVKLAEKLFEAVRKRGVVSPENFERGLLSIIGFANHISNDIPKIYEWLARFLFAAGFDKPKVEELASKIEVEGVPRIHPRDQLLKEFEKVRSPSGPMNALPRGADDRRPTKEEERKAKEKEELRLRKEFERHERAKAKAQARKESKRRDKEEKEAQLKAEAEARIKKAAELEAKQEAERKAREEEERKAKEEEELRLKEKAERKARAREEAIARRQAKRKEKEERDAQLKSEAEAKARAEAERKAREEEERRVRDAEERQLKEETERKARLKAEAEEKARAEEEARARQEAEHRAKQEAERKAREEERVRLRAEAEAKAREEAALKAKLEAEREAREQEERRIRDEKERKTKEEERRLKDEAERKAREERKAKVEEERRLKEAERKAREAEEARLKAEAEAKAKAEEEARLKEEAERKAKEEAERRAKEEEEARLKAEAEAKAREEAEARTKADAEAAEAAAKASEEAEARRTPSPSASPRHTNNLLRSIVPSYPSPPSFIGDSDPDSNANDVPGQLGTLPPPLLDNIGPEPRERDTSYPTSARDEDRQSAGPSGSGSASIGGQATPTTQSMWPGGAEDNVPPVSYPLEPVAPLKVSENRWVGGSMQGTQQKIQDLLNKLTVDNFDWTSRRIVRYANRSEQVNDGSMLMQVVKLVFASARDSPMYAGMYARLCHRMTESLSPNIQDDTTQDWDEQATTGGMLFRKYLFASCQAEFQRGWDVKGLELAAASRARRRDLGLVRFMGELFRLQMLTERTVHGCIKKLLSNVVDPKEEDIESLCGLLGTVGQTLDSPKARNQMDTYFERMKETANRSNLNWRIRFMLLDVIELRARQWQARPPGNSTSGPSSGIVQNSFVV